MVHYRRSIRNSVVFIATPFFFMPGNYFLRFLDVEKNFFVFLHIIV